MDMCSAAMRKPVVRICEANMVSLGVVVGRFFSPARNRQFIRRRRDHEFPTSLLCLNALERVVDLFTQSATSQNADAIKSACFRSVLRSPWKTWQATLYSPELALGVLRIPLLVPALRTSCHDDSTATADLVLLFP